MGYIDNAINTPMQKVVLPLMTAAGAVYTVDKALLGRLMTSISQVPDCVRTLDDGVKGVFYRELGRSYLAMRDWSDKNIGERTEAMQKINQVGNYLEQRVYCEGLASNPAAEFFHNAGYTINSFPEEVRGAAYMVVLSAAAITAYIVSVGIWDVIGKAITREGNNRKQQTLEEAVAS